MLALAQHSGSLGPFDCRGPDSARCSRNPGLIGPPPIRVVTGTLTNAVESQRLRATSPKAVCLSNPPHGLTNAVTNAAFGLKHLKQAVPGDCGSYPCVSEQEHVFCESSQFPISRRCRASPGREGRGNSGKIFAREFRPEIEDSYFARRCRASPGWEGRGNSGKIFAREFPHEMTPDSFLKPLGVAPDNPGGGEKYRKFSNFDHQGRTENLGLQFREHAKN